VSGPAGQAPGSKIAKLIRAGDLIRIMWHPPGKSRGRCLDPECTWPGPVGTTPHNISRECMRHTRKTGHGTRFATLELAEYRPRPGSSGRSERP
jgi:hypothetical protein